MKLDFKELEKKVLKSNAKSEYKQATIVILRNIFKEAETKQCDIHSVVVNEAKLRYETCQRGKLIICKCKNDQDCKEQSEVAYYCECDNQVSKKDVSGTLYCINCEWDIKQ